MFSAMYAELNRVITMAARYSEFTGNEHLRHEQQRYQWHSTECLDEHDA